MGRRVERGRRRGGTYLHGLLANDFRRALLEHLAGRRGVSPDPRWGAPSSAAERCDRLADVVGAGCDLATIGNLVELELGDAARRVPR